MPGHGYGFGKRLEKARKRLSLARHEMMKMDAMARHIEELDAELALFSRAAFLRRLSRVCAGKASGWSLAALRFGCAEDLRAGCQIVLGHTRSTDRAGRASQDTIVILLSDCNAPGAWSAVRRLSRQVRDRKGRRPRPCPPSIGALSLIPGDDPEAVLNELCQGLRPAA